MLDALVVLVKEQKIFGKMLPASREFFAWMGGMATETDGRFAIALYQPPIKEMA